MPRKTAYAATKRTIQNSHSAIVLSESESRAVSAIADKDDLQRLMDRAVTEDDWLLLFGNALRLSLGGNMVAVKAMEFLAKYRFGLPAQIMAATAGDQSRITIVEVVRAQGDTKTELLEPPELPEPEHKSADQLLAEIESDTDTIDDTVPF